MKTASTLFKPVVDLWQYFKDSWAELQKVTWPTRQQTMRLTGAVIVFSLVFAVLSGMIDFGLTEGIKQVIGEPPSDVQPLPSAPTQGAPAIPGQGF